MEIYSSKYIYEKIQSQINNLVPTLRHQEKKTKEQNKPRGSRKKEIMKIKTGINEIEDRKTLEKINEIQDCFF